MRAPILLASALAHHVAALPQLATAGSQIPFSDHPLAVDSIAATFEKAIDRSGRWALQAKEEASALLDDIQILTETIVSKIAHGKDTGGFRTEKVAIDNIEYDRITLPAFPEYAVRLMTPEGLCDNTVKQYSGYLDVSETKHLFFWFFESRNEPESDPFVLWLNGGPGCSSSTGLGMELGPCSMVKGGKTKFNEYGWNSKANLLFIDQPVSVGFSYSDGQDSINNSDDSAADIYAFLQLFLQKYPKYSKLPFTVAAESYGGHYAPHIAHKIFEENAKKLPLAIHINLATVMIGNGLTEPSTQMAYVPEYACAPSEHALFDEETCTSLRNKVPTCQRLNKYCYDSPSRFTCVPATLYCWSTLYGPFQSTGLNPYDVRKPCDRNANPLCYEEMNWIEEYMNLPHIKKTLGVPSSLSFESCNMRVNRAFQMNGDNAHNSAALLPILIQSGIRLLVYAGVEDFMCNYMGNEAWMKSLDTPFTKEFNQKTYDFVTEAEMVDVHGARLPGAQKAGHVRFGGHGAGNYTYVSLIGAGHMVPYDQPAVALELVNRWLTNEPWV